MKIRIQLIVLLLLTVSLLVHAQGTKYVQLLKEPLGYSPREFYIKDVVDDRADGSSIGIMMAGSKRDKVALEDGTVAYLKAFLSNNVKQDDSKLGVVLHLSKTDIDIKKSGAVWAANAGITFVYYLGDRKLIEYSSKGRAEIDTDPLAYVGNFLRQSMENNIRKFDAWWPQNRDRIPTATDVKLIVNIGKLADKPNWILYSAQRPLQVADFTGPEEKNAPEMAATSSGIGMSYTSKTEKGQTVVTVTIAPYFDKTESWFKPAAKNGHVLVHEQTHFDITAAKACEFVVALRGMTFTQATYQKAIKDLQDANTKATTEEQDLYDSETNHGIIRDKQEAWEQRVRERLRKGGCY